jgi:hypothetical protein
MLIEPIFLALLIGYMVKGKLTNLLAIQWRGLYLPIGAVLIEGVASLIHERRMLDFDVTLGIQVLVYGLLIAFFVMNRHISGLQLVGVGVFLNLVVVFANGGYMPVSTTMAEAYGFVETLTGLKQGAIFGHNVLTPETTLSVLGDWIHIPPPYWFPKSVSPGDLIMDFGFVVTIISGMRKGA